MSQRRNARQPDGADRKGRSTVFYAPGDKSVDWRRDSVRYSTPGRRSRNVRVGEMSPGSSLPANPGVRSASPRNLALIGVVILLLCVIVIAIAAVLINSGNAQKTGLERATAELSAIDTAGRIAGYSGSSSSAIEEGSSAGPVNKTYDLAADDVLALSGSRAVVSIDLAERTSVPVGSDSAYENIRNAVTTAESLGDCGFVFFDVDTGKGLAYNADEVMYVASAAKAPFVYWLLSTTDGLDEYERELVEYTIVDSDNESFEILFADHYNEDYASMMSAHGVEHEDYWGNYYPAMNARQLASLWADILLYIQEGSDGAQSFASLLSTTETSFIRDGLNSAGAVVMNKAGWIDEDDFYSSVTDAAIVEADGHTYIMVIVTSAYDGGEAEEHVAALARTLFNTRSSLA